MSADPLLTERLRATDRVGEVIVDACPVVSQSSENPIPLERHDRISEKSRQTRSSSKNSAQNRFDICK